MKCRTGLPKAMKSNQCVFTAAGFAEMQRSMFELQLMLRHPVEFGIQK